jgi:hypothetical protein
MDNLSFADKKKLFNASPMPVMQVRAPKAPPTIINETPTERSTSNILNQSSGKINFFKYK